MLVTLQTQKPLIRAVIKYEHRLTETVEQFKAVVELVDGSYLHINEVWFDGDLKKYAYYWLTPTDRLIQGWDNAPHHPEIDTYPHHTHYENQITSSSIRSIIDVLAALHQKLVIME